MARCAGGPGNRGERYQRTAGGRSGVPRQVPAA